MRTSSRSHLLGLEVAVLPLLGLGVLVGHLLAEPAVVGLADLSPHLHMEEGQEKKPKQKELRNEKQKPTCLGVS